MLPIFFASRFFVACIFPAVSRCGGMLQREHRAQHLRPSHKSYLSPALSSSIAAAMARQIKALSDSPWAL